MPRRGAGASRGTRRRSERSSVIGPAAEASAELTRAVVDTALAAGAGAATMTRQATEAMIEQAGNAGQAAMDFTDRVVSTVTGQSGQRREDEEEEDEDSRSRDRSGGRSED